MSSDAGTYSITVRAADSFGRSKTQTFDLTVTAVDDAPVITITNTTPVAFTENGAAVTLDTLLTLTDEENNDITGVTITIGGKVAGDTLEFDSALATTFGISESGTVVGTDGTLELTGTATAAQYEQLLRTVKFVTPSDDPGSTTRTITFSVLDGTHTSTATRSVSVTAVNDAPVFSTAATGAQGFGRGDVAVSIDADLVLTDPDAANYNGATLTVTITSNGDADDRLAIANAGTSTGQIGFSGSTITYGGTVIGTVDGTLDGVGTNALSITLNANATKAATQALLRSLTYNNTNASVDVNLDRVVTIELQEADGTTATAYTRTIDIVDNIAPTITSAPTFATNEDTTFTFSATSFDSIFQDSNIGDTLQAIRIETLPSASIGVLKLSGVAVTAGQQITRAQLANLTFEPATDANNGLNGAATFTFKVGDGKSFSTASATATINVSAVDDAPRLTATAGRTYAVAGARAVVVDPLILIVDPDALNASTGTYADTGTGYLQATISSGRIAGDVLSIKNIGTGAGQIGFDGTTVTYGGVVIGTIDGTLNGNSNASLKINLNSSASNDAVQALGRAITIEATNIDQGSAATKIVTFSASDGQNASTTIATRTIDYGDTFADTFTTTNGTRPVLSFDGVNDHVTMAANSVFQSAKTAMTMEGWINTSVNSSAIQTIFSLGSASASQTLINANFSSIPSAIGLTGNATVTGGILRLTSAANDQYGKAVIDPTGNAEGARNFTATFDLKMGESTTAHPADGFTFSYGNNTFASTITGNGTDFENGVLDGLTIAFDTFDNGGTDTINGIDVILNGTVVHHANVTGGTRTSLSTHAASFDGNGDALVRIGDSALDQSGAVTFEAWIKPDSLPTSGYYTIVCIGGPEGDGNSAENYSMLVELLPNGKIRVFHEYDTGTNQEVTFSPTIPIDEWTHIAISRSTAGVGGSYVLYIDGSLAGVESFSNDPSDGSAAYFAIGAEFASETTLKNEFSGQMDDVRIWDDARTSAEIAANWNKELTGTESGLVAYYTFDNSLTQDDSSNQGAQTLSSNFISGQFASRVAITDSRIQAEFVSVTIRYDENGLTVIYDGVTEISNLDLGANYAPNTTDVFTLAARTGNQNDLHAIDNLTITATDLGTRNAIAVQNGKLVFVTEEHYGAETNGGVTISASTTSVVNAWHYVAATHDGNNTLRLYVDGQLVQTITGVPKNILSGGAQIGSADDNSDYFSGLINEIRLWNEARSATQIADDYLPDLSNTSSETTLVGYWKAADISGSTVTDSSNNSNNGTISGATTTTTTTLYPGPNSTDWVVLDGTSTSTSNDIAYVDTATGELVIQNRELVRTADQFSPSTAAPVHVTGTFKFSGGTSDYFSVVTRANPASTTSTGFPQNGINFTALNGSESITIEKYVNGTLQTLTITGDSAITLTNGKEYTFEVYDDGSNLRLTITEVGNSGNTATVTATDGTNYATNYVVITNRNDTGTTENVVRVDDIRIDHDIVMDEDGSHSGTLPSTGLGSGLTFSVLQSPDHGTLTITDASTGAYTYTPATGFHGQDTFNFQVVDSDGKVNTQTISFNVVADLDVLVAGKNLTFDGSDDYVSLASDGELMTGTGDFTYEAWIKPDTTGNRGEFISIGTGSNGAATYFHVTSDGKVEIDVHGEAGPKSTTSVTGGEWHHVAATYDASTKTLSIYVDGQLEATKVMTSTINIASGNAYLGNSVDGTNRYYDGQLDEVRIWNEARSADDIRLNYDQQVSPTESGLVGYYSFDNVLNGVVTDKTSNDNDGYLGASDTIGDSAEPTVTSPTSAANMPEVYGSTIQVAENKTANGVMVHDDAISGSVSYAVVDGANLVTSFTTAKGGTVNINSSTGEWSYTPASNYYGSDTFTLRATGATSGTDEETVSVTVDGGSDENSVGMPDGVLQLDGNGDYVDVAHNSALNFGTGAFTVEAWGRALDNNANSEMLTKIGDENTINESGWALRFINDGATAQFLVQYYNGSSLQVAKVEYAVTEGEWYQLAGVREANGTIKLYVNGELAGSDSLLGAVSVDNSRDLLIGADHRVSGGTEYMRGNVDEVRIWEDARTAEEIALNYQNQLDGDEQGLVAYYKFDDSTADGKVTNNATGTDSGGSALDGTLVGNATTINVPVNAAHFAGSDDYLEVMSPTNGILTGTGSYTYETWVNTTKSSLQTVLGTGGTGGGGTTLRLDASGRVEYNNTGYLAGTAEVVSTSSVNDGLWHHVAIVYDATTGLATVYVDGVAEAIGDAHSPNITAGRLIIGEANDHTAGRDYEGDLANTRFWTTARTAQEIADNFNKVLTGSEDGLASQYLYDEIVSGGYVDSAGGNDLPITGDVTTVGATATVQGTLADIDENQSVSGEMAANDVAGTPTYGVEVAGKTTSDAGDGRISIDTANGGKVVIDTTSGAWTYTPANNWYSQTASDYDTFTLTASGANGTTDSETIKVHVNNIAEASVVINDGVMASAGATGSYGLAALGTNTITNQMSLEFKVNFTELTNSTQSILYLADASDKRFVSYVDSSGKLFLYLSNNAQSIATNITVHTDTWYDIAITYDGATAKIYVDGNLAGSAANAGMTLGNSAQELLLGADLDGAAQPSNVLLDEVKVWSTVRTDAQVRADIDQTVASGTSSLVAYYKFDDETTSGTVQDKSGNNRDMTLHGNTKVIDDLRGGVTMDGGDNITIANSTALDNAKGTWSLWMKTDGDWTNDGSTNTSNYAVLMTRADATSSHNGLTLSMQPNGTLQIEGKDADGTSMNVLTSGVNVADGGWHQITVVYDTAVNGLNKLYVDGVLVATATSSEAWSFNGQDLLIGDSNDNFWSSLKGEIGGVEIYNRQLTDEEVVAGFGHETNPATSGLVGLYDFTEGTGTTAANDATGATQAADATLTGTTWLDLDNDTTATTLVIQEDEIASGRLLANDVPGTPSYSVQTNGQNGTVTVNSDGTWSYVPRGNFHGQDTFTLRISGTDANGTVYNDDETVTVTVNSVADGHSVKVADGAGSFDGANDYVSVADSSSLDITGDLTIEVWINAQGNTGNASTGGVIAGKNNAYLLARRDDGSIAFALNGPGGTWGWTDTGYDVPANTWVHLALTYDASERTVKLYADGNLVATSVNGFIPTSLTAGTELFAIGGRPGTNENFNGLIDEVRVWSTLRSDEEIRDNYDQQLSGDETSLQAYYRFDDDTDGNVVRDYTGNGNDGTLTDGADIGSSGATVYGNALEIQTSETAGGTFTTADLPTGATFTINESGANSSGGTSSFTTAHGGTVSLNESTGAWTYTPASGYYGDDSFTLRGTYTNNSQTMTDDEKITVTVKSDNNVDLNGGFLQVNAADSWVNVGDANDLDVTTAFTLEAWINPQGDSSNATYGGVIAGKEDAYLLSRRDDGSIYFALNGPGGTWTWTDTGYDVAAGSWTHLALTFDGGTRTVLLFADGELVSTSTNGNIPTSITAGTGDFAIGGRPLIDEEFNGQIDEVRLWNTVRTADQISENYDQKLSGTYNNTLVGNWTFDQDGGGTTINDSAGTNNSGTLAGNAKIVANLGGALDFDGSTTYINAGRGAGNSLAIAGDMTVETWVKVDALSGTQAIVDFAHPNDASADNVLYQLSIRSDGDIEYAHESGNGDNSDAVIFDTNLVAGQWYHIAFTRDVSSNLIKLYIDGVLFGSASYGTNDPDGGSSAELIIGANGAGGSIGTNKLNGQLSDLRIWSTVRTGEEIAEYMDNVLTGDQDGQLVANWRFDEASGSTAADSSGTQSAVTITGTAHWVDTPPNVFGTAITIDENETLQGAFNAAGADGSATFAASASNGGTVSINSSTGQWTYTPAQNYNGTETLTFTATGAQGTTDTETVTVTITADALQVSPVSNSAALKFDGTGDHVALPADAINNLTTGTIETWVYLDSTTGETIFSKQHAGTDTYALFTVGYTQDGSGGYVNGPDGQIYFQAANSGANLASNTILETGQWYHVAVTFSGTEARLYVNGELDKVQGGNFSIPNDTATGQDAWIGDWSVGSGYGLDGMIDEFRVWSDIRTADEIRDNYDQQVASNAANLVGYWNADGSTGTTVQDLTSNDNDGTLIGDTEVAYLPLGAVKLDGNGDTISLGASGTLATGTGSFTQEIRFLTSGNSGARQDLISVGNASVVDAGSYLFIDTDGQLKFGLAQDGGSVFSTGVVVTDGEWHHAAIVYDAATGRKTLYLDGNAAAISSAGTVNLSGGTATIGYSNANTGYFNGLVSDARFWNDARTAEEIAENMDKTITSSSDSSLIASYPMNEGSGTTVNDAVGTHDGTLAGDAAFTDALPAIHTNTATVAENHSVTGQMTPNDVVPTSAQFGVSSSNAVSTDTSLTIAGKGTVTIEPSTGEWVFTPNANWSGTASFYLSASGGGKTDVEQFTVTVNAVSQTSNIVTTAVAQFDGTGDHLDATLSAMAVGTGSFTVETWFNTTQAANALIDMGNSAANNQALRLYMSSGNLYVATPGTVLGSSGAETFNDGNWHHSAVVYDGVADTLSLYIDGALVSKTSNVALNITDGNIRLGGIQAEAGGGLPYDGMLSDVRFWSDARTSAEIAVNKDQQLTGAEDHLEGYYSFDDHNGSTVTNEAHDGISLNGSDNYVAINNVDLANKSFTIEAWVYRDSSTSADIFAGLGNDGSNQALHIGYRDDGNFAFAFYNDDLLYDDPEGDGVGEWVHWAATYDATTNTQTLYKNGEAVATRTANADFNPADTLLEIGRYYQADGTNSWNGSIDDFRVWTDVRSAAEIQASMNTTLSGNEDNLLVNMDFNGTGTTVTNQAATGSTYDGTVNGTNAATLQANTDAAPLSDAIHLDGTNQNLTATSNSTMLFTNSESFTLETWVTLDNVGANLKEFFDHGVADANDYSNFRFGSVNGNLYVYSKSASEGFYNTGTANGILQAGVPTHVAVSYDAATDTVKFFVNGEEVPVQYSNDNGVVSYTSSAWEPASDVSPTALYIGTDSLAVANNVTNDRYVGGSLDDARVWSTARTAEEIAENYTKTMTSSESGLVAQWTFDNANNLGAETTGNYAASLVHGPTATTMNRPNETNAPEIIDSLSKAVNLDGTDDYIAAGDLNTTFGDMTVETWIKLDTLTSGSNRMLLASDGTWSAGDVHIQFDPTTGKLQWDENGAGASTVLDYDFRELVGEWAHIAIVKDRSSGELRLSVNGDVVAVTSMDQARWTSTVTLSAAQIGYYASGDARALDAQIADFRIWDTARTADEIALNYDRPVTGDQDGHLIVRYDFDNVTGTSVTDTTGGNNGTLTNGASVIDATPTHYGTHVVIEEDQAVSGTMTASDLVGTATYSATAQPANGTLTINSSTGDWTYTPNANFSGTDRFTLQASDGTFTDSETITVTVEGDSDPNVSNKVFQFDGQNTYVTGTLGSNTITGAFTIEYWAKYDDFATDQNPFRIDGTTGSEPRLVVTTASSANGQPSIFWGTSSSATSYAAGFSYAAETWSHIAITYDGTTLTFYKDGVAGNSYSVATNPLVGTGEQTLTFGADLFASGDPAFDFNGQMDDIRVWTVARSAQQIADNYDKQLTGSENGLVAYYTADDVSGNVVQDQSNANHDATIHGGNSAPVILPALGDAMVFDGVDDKILVADASDLNSTKGTWAVTFKTDGLWGTDGSGGNTDFYSILMRKMAVANNSGLSIALGRTNNTILVQAVDGTHGVATLSSASAGVTDDQWHQLVVTYNQGTGSDGSIQLYLDGALIDQVTGVASWAIGSGPLTIGDSSDTYWEQYKGQVADVRVYDRILSATEISDGLSDGLPSTDANLKLHLDMADVDGTTLNDASNAGNIVTLTGTPTTVSTAPDIQGNSIIVDKGGEAVGSMTGADVTGTAGYSIAESPKHGTLTLNTETGDWRYTPSTTYVGSDSFTLRATGSVSGTDLETIAVTVSGGADDDPIPTQTAMQFDGINDYVDVGALSSNISGAFGFESWVKVSSQNFSDQSWMRIIDFGQGPNNDNLLLAFDPANDQLSFDIRNGYVASSVKADYTMPTDQWVHVAGFNDGSGTSYLYINGELIATATGQQTAQNVAREYSYIGKSNWPNETAFNGEMAEVRIWNTYRSAEEVKAAYDKQLTGSESGLLAYYTFDDIENGVLVDRTSNNNDAEIKTTTTTGTASTTSGILTLDGSGDYVEVPVSTVNNLTAGTIETWVKLDANTGETIFAKQHDGVNSYAVLSVGYRAHNNDGVEGKIYFLSSNSGAALTSTGTIETGVWHHVAITFTGTEANLYIDGQLDTTQSGNFSIPNDLTADGNTSARIGSWKSNSYDLDGQLENFRVWTDVRTESEIKDGMYKTYASTEGNMLAQYTFESSGSSTATSSGSSASLNGTLVGNAAQASGSAPPVNTATSVEGPTGNVLSLDGTGDGVVTAVDAAVQLTGNITYEAWIRPDSLTTSQALISIAGNTNTDSSTENQLFHVGLANNNIYVQHEYGAGGPSRAATSFSNTGLTQSEWNHIAITRNVATNTFELFINGISVGSYDYGAAGASDPDGGTNANLTIGALRVSAGDVNSIAGGFDGDMDNVRVWDTVRTAEQIREGMSQSYDYDTANLVAQYTFDNVSGSTVYDTAQSYTFGNRQNNNDGTLIGDAKVVDSGSGGGTALNFLDKAIHFDGTGDTATAVTGLAPTGSAARTIMMWAKTSSDSAQALASYGSNTDNGAIRFTLNGWGAGQGVSVDTNSGAITFQSETGISDGQWHHYALVIPAGGSLRDLQVYQDGVLLTTITAMWNNADTPISTGDDQAFKLGTWNGGEYFNGDMAEVSVWNTALTTAQINQYMSEQLSGSETGLSAYWRGSDDGSGKVQDFTSGNHDLTLGGDSSIVDVAPDIHATSIRISEDTIATGQMTGDDVSGTASYGIVNGSNTVTSFTTTNNGTVTIDPTTGVWNYVPSGTFSGTDTFTLKATGDNGTTDSESVSIRVGEDPVAPHMYSMSLDGTNDYITADAESSVLTGTGDFTYEVWFKTDDTTSRMGLVGVGNADDPGTKGTGTYLYIDGNQLKFGSAYEFSSATTTANVADGAWHHAAVSYVGSSQSFSLYLDGALAASGTMTTQINVTEGEVAIGADITGHASQFDGQLADVRIWDTARTATEIANNYDKTLTGDETNLAAYYNFNEGSGSVTTDKTGNGNDGAVIGDASYTDMTNVSLAASTSYKGLILGADADSNDSLSYTLKTQAEHGTVTLDSDGSYTYSGTTVDDSFEVTISDNNGNSTDHVVHFDVT